MKDTLLPCPFCGNSATFRQWKGQEFIECLNFSCQAQTMPIDIDELSRREQLSVLWNRRVSATPSDGCGKGRMDKERLDQWSDEDKKEMARVEAQSKEEALAELLENGANVGKFTERVNQIVDAGVSKHGIYCKITRSDGSVHMLPDPTKVGDVEWQLRYGKPESVRWEAASVLAFYRTFFSLPYKSRIEVMTKLLAASSIGKDGGK